jgi:ribulose-phosphate 3-epimerase
MVTQKLKSIEPKIKIAPSLLSADFSRLADEIQDVEKAGADWLHLDVMDGHFVPNLTFGPLVVQSLRSLTQLPFDCHLMVSEPEKWVEPFVRAGANHITVHLESTPHLNRLIHQIKDRGCSVGVSLNPATPLAHLEEVLDIVDLVLIMSVNPGFGGQSFIENSYSKISRLNAMRGNRKFLIEVDGGVNQKNIRLLQKAGADVFVVGTSVFGQKNRKQAISALRQAVWGDEV